MGMEEIQNSYRSAISQLEDGNLGSTLLSSFDKAKASVNSYSSSSSSEAIPTGMPPPMVIRAPGYFYFFIKSHCCFSSQFSRF